MAPPRRTLTVRRTAELDAELDALRDLYDRRAQGSGPHRPHSAGAIVKHAVHELHKRELGAALPPSPIGQETADLEGPAL